MSLMGTLAKMAIGVIVAKGVGGMMKGSGNGGGGLLDGLRGNQQQPQAGGSGGIEDIQGGFLGGQQQSGQAGQTQGGGLGGLLEELGGGNQQAGGQASGGGLGDLIGGLTQGQQGGAGGGIGDILGQLAGGAGAGGAGGGLGDILGKLTGGAQQQAQTSNDNGGFGDLLNQAFQKKGEPEVQPSMEQEAVAGLMLRAMIQSAKSDGKLDDGERMKLMENLGEISPEEKNFVDQELDSPVDIEGLASQVPAGLEQQVYVMSVMGIELDTPDEAKYLHGLAGAMNMDQNTVNAIHDKLGVQRLYS